MLQSPSRFSCGSVRIHCVYRSVGWLDSSIDSDSKSGAVDCVYGRIQENQYVVLLAALSLRRRCVDINLNDGTYGIIL
jgi:hypothetical protein